MMTTNRHHRGILVRGPLNFRLFTVLGCVVTAMIGGCSSEEPTALVVVTDTDIQRPDVIDQIVVTLDTPSSSQTASQFLSAADEFPLYVTLVPTSGEPGPLVVQAEGFKAGASVVRRRSRVSMVPEGRISVLELHLLESCVGSVCEGTCTDLGCQPLSESALTTWAGTPPGLGNRTRCVIDEDCADDDFCNGDERCIEGVCAGGSDRICDDNILCTDDRCDNDEGACVFTPNNALCTAAANGMCDVENDCQYANCTPATCQDRPELCQTAQCVGNRCELTSTCVADKTCCAGSCVNMNCENPEDPCGVYACGATGCEVVDDRDGEPCSDGNACTTNDRCMGATCAGQTITCPEDDNACTRATCFPLGGGCGHAPDPTMSGQACDDGNGCTIDTRCNGPVCGGGQPPLGCQGSNCICESFGPSTYECLGSGCDAFF